MSRPVIRPFKSFRLHTPPCSHDPHCGRECDEPARRRAKKSRPSGLHTSPDGHGIPDRGRECDEPARYRASRPFEESGCESHHKTETMRTTDQRNADSRTTQHSNTDVQSQTHNATRTSGQRNTDNRKSERCSRKATEDCVALLWTASDPRSTGPRGSPAIAICICDMPTYTQMRFRCMSCFMYV